MKNASHPSVQQFKMFAHKHPLLIKEIKQGKLSLQDTYEQFMLLGESDPYWDKFKNKQTSEDETEESSSQLYQKLMKHIGQLDLDEVENHISDLNGAIGNVLTLIDQFKEFRSNQADSSQADHFFNRPKD